MRAQERADLDVVIFDLLDEILGQRANPGDHLADRGRANVR